MKKYNVYSRNPINKAEEFLGIVYATNKKEAQVKAFYAYGMGMDLTKVQLLVKAN